MDAVNAVKPLAESLQQGLLATMLALTLIAIAWLFIDSRKRDAEHAAQLAAATEARMKELQAAFAAHLATAMKLEPLAAKLADCVVLMDRMLTIQQAKGTAQ